MDISEIKKAGKTLWYRFRGECIFCKLSENKDAEIVYEDTDVMAFAPLKNSVLAEGHVLVIPREHHENLFEIPEDVLCSLMSSAKEIAERLESSGECTGVNILHASGESAQQSVSHFHLHLVPRKEDGLDLWPETGYREGNYEEVYNRLKEELEQ